MRTKSTPWLRLVVGIDRVREAEPTEASLAEVPEAEIADLTVGIRETQTSLAAWLRGLEGRSTGRATVDATCANCGAELRASRSDARYCSTRCRVAAHRKRATAVTTVTAPAGVEKTVKVLGAKPMAYRCDSCGEEFAKDDANRGQGALYECGDCGTRFSRVISADMSGNRCPDCYKFSAKAAEMACPECGEGELEPSDPE